MRKFAHASTLASTLALSMALSALAACATPVQTASEAVAPSAALLDLRGEPGPSAPGQPYAASSLPDRIILTPAADPSTGMGLTWRTDMAAAETVAELAELTAAPAFRNTGLKVSGTSVATLSENGEARYHKVRFTGLKPDTAYAYRVKGSAGFSEWHQFRTASASDDAFRFLYFGDTQNGILDFGSLAWRRALLQAGNPQLILHAGDLVASRDDMIHDDEWGQWTQAGGWALAAIPQVPAAGNHEYVDLILEDGSESRRLADHWPVTFALPENGVSGTTETTYVVDYQGVRIIVLDGTSALDLGTRESQTEWLDARLTESRANWNIVMMHQPIFTCARPRDTEKLKEAWKPIFDKHGVDLVLQGHDHCYSRLTADAGREAGEAARAGGAAQGPVYIVSVAGSKMYGLNDRANSQPDRSAEDTSLFQIVDVTPQQITFRSYLNTGALYDGFDLIKRADGTNELINAPDALAPLRRCAGPAQIPDSPMPSDRLGPDGYPCTAEVKD